LLLDKPSVRRSIENAVWSVKAILNAKKKKPEVDFRIVREEVIRTKDAVIPLA